MAYVGQPTRCGFVEEHPIPGTRLVAHRHCARMSGTRMWGTCERDGHLFTDDVSGIRVKPVEEDWATTRNPEPDSSGTTETEAT